METKAEQTTTSSITPETQIVTAKTAATTKLRTSSMNESYTMNSVDSLELISNRIIGLLTMHDVKSAAIGLKMNIETDALETENQVQTQSLSQKYVLSGAEALPLILDHIKALYVKHSISNGVKSAKISVALKLFVPKV